MTASDVRLLIGSWDEELIELGTFASKGEVRMHSKAIKKYKTKHKNLASVLAPRAGRVSLLVPLLLTKLRAASPVRVFLVFEMSD